MRSRTITVIVLMTLALATSWFLLGRNENITNYPPKGTTVVAFGDSLVEGVGSTPGNDFVSRVSRQVSVPIANLGKAGDTTVSALTRTDEVLTLKPAIVLVLLGGNDAIQRVPMKETEANLLQIITRFQGAGAVVVMLGVRGGLLGDPYEGMYKRIAKRTGSAYVPNVLKGLFGDPRYMDDSIHPNDEGYALIADRVAPVLSRILNKVK